MNEKPTLIFLHGWGSKGSSSWKNNEETFIKSGFNCLSIKLPGFDLAPPPTIWGIPQYSDYVLNQLSNLNIKPPYTFIGHSFGGRISIYIASKYPNKVSRLILSDAAGVANRNTPKLFLIKTCSKIFQYLENIKLLKNFIKSLKLKLLNVTASDDYTKANPLMKEILKKVVELDLKPHLKNISAKTLIIWGENDTITPLKEAKTLNKYIKNSKVIIIPNTGHHAHSDKYIEWNKHVLNFLIKN